MKTLRIISYNVNGIRAALNKGLLEWLSSDPADIICLQEIETGQYEDFFKEQLHHIGTKMILNYL